MPRVGQFYWIWHADAWTVARILYTSGDWLMVSIIGSDDRLRISARDIVRRAMPPRTDMSNVGRG